MKSHLRNTFGVTVAVFGLMIFSQVAFAQSGSRGSSSFQLSPSTRSQALPSAENTYGAWQESARPLQTFPSAPVQETYGAWQNSPQQEQYTPYQTQAREITRIGFEQYNHRAWDELLQKYVDGNGDVDYATWQSNSQDRATLLSYLQNMSSVDTSQGSSLQSEMAFWINTYNALTIEGILQLYPTRSIKDHAPDANGFNIWDDFKLPVGGTEYSLNDIEHKVLRKMGDPRIHFAIVCASKSCPQLSQRAYFADSLDQQLNYSSSLFFHTPSKFSYDLQRGQLGLSPIIQWFGEDFGRSDQERLQYLSQFMPSDAGRLAASGSASISYLDYDWGLNVAPVQALAPSQNLVSVRALRPQGSATRESLPSQSYAAPQQSYAAQQSYAPPQSYAAPQQDYTAPQGSTTRYQFETSLPVQSELQRPRRRCSHGRNRSQAGNDYRGFGQ